MAKTGRLVGAIIVLVGAILLIAAAFMPWYTYEQTGSGPVSGSVTQNSYPGLPSQSGTIQYTCSGNTGSVCPTNTSTSYSNLNLSNTGALAETGYFMMIGGFVLGLIGAVLGLASRKRPGRAMGGAALAIVAMILAVAAPALFAVQLPGALGNDVKNHPSSGPWSTFIGSNSTNVGGGETVNTTGGPAIGWYLSIGAFVVLLIGAIILARARKEPPSPAPTTVPAPATTSSAPAAGAPPTS